ncbi:MULTISPECIES: ABC transporter permease [Thermomonosporaceae]|uniref:ABC transporter permease n=1 Tax=Thermomonosporaceae TaxID=2012 RepID=UPI00255B2FB1|nr:MULTISPECIES: ABC transporter permease [Thermomonosporaceae]MDL4773005.1 ABC transporter permease [Actinomadura xylanilytica]
MTLQQEIAAAYRVDDSAGTPLRRLLGAREFGVFAATIVIFVVCAIGADGFLATDNLLSIAQQIAILGIVATGMTFLVIAGEIDLSVGSLHGFLAVELAWLVTKVGVPIGTAAPLAILTGAAVGLVNGLITTKFKIPSFVVTLAALSVLRGAALLLANGVPVRGSRDSAFIGLVSGTPLPHLAAQVLWLVAIVAIGAYVLTKTKFGFDVYSVGGNRSAAAGAGIPADRVKISCFALTGALTGVASVILVGWLGSANPLTGNGFELGVIAAVVVGGAGLAGGTGSLLGTLLGAVITGVITNALVLFGVDGNWQQVATGALILAAVMLNQLVARRSPHRRH